MSLIITQEFSCHHNMASNMPYSTHIAFVLFVHIMHLPFGDVLCNGTNLWLKCATLTVY